MFYSIDLVKGIYSYIVFIAHREYVYSTGGYGISAEGQIRLKRTGSTLAAFYRAQGASTWSSMSTHTSARTDDLYVYISFAGEANTAGIRLANFQRVSGNALATSGVYTSPIYDAGRIVSWDRIQWTENLPSGCDIELEVCVADDYAEFEDFVSPPAWFGPTGGGNFTTPAGESLPSGKTGRYAMVRATLTGNGSATPTLSDIQLTCNAGSDTGSRVIRTQYDEAGNILKITTIDDLGVSEDVRDDDGWSAPDRINTLNQIMRQDVGGDTWTFSYDLNGNMTGKTNGVDTWTYTWDTLDSRLTRVQGPGGVDVSYAYDSSGRMLSRDNGVDLTVFLWDEWHVARETTGLTTTTYCIPEGYLQSFIRGGSRFDAHLDALGSVRLVTDENGDVVSRFDFSAFGGLLEGSFDGVPGGMPYAWIGSFGIRTDADSGLIYMRSRWYDPQLQRFLSRDPIGTLGGPNLYSYAANSPTNLVDPGGDAPQKPDASRLRKRLRRIISELVEFRKFQNCVERVLLTNRIVIQEYEIELLGDATHPGEIRLNSRYSEDLLVYVLFHEILHKAAEDPLCNCVDKDFRYSPPKLTKNRTTGNWEEDYFDQKMREAKEQRTHGWIYDQTNRLFQSRVPESLRTGSDYTHLREIEMAIWSHRQQNNGRVNYDTLPNQLEIFGDL